MDQEEIASLSLNNSFEIVNLISRGSDYEDKFKEIEMFREEMERKMAQLINDKTTLGASLGTSLGFPDGRDMTVEDIVKISDMMGGVTQWSDPYETNPYGRTAEISSISASSSAAVTGPPTYKTEAYAGEDEVKRIIRLREKISDFLDGSNTLLKLMHPQTIREMVRDMRNEVRQIKKDSGISELDIIEYLEKQYGKEKDYQDELPF